MVFEGGRGHCLIRGTIPESAWRDYETPRKASAKVVCVLAKIQTGYLPNTNQKGVTTLTETLGTFRIRPPDSAVGVRVPVRARLFSSS
jgi:hypothetical protein